MVFVFFFKQKTAYEMRISDWSSDVCSSDLAATALPAYADTARAAATAGLGVNAGHDLSQANLGAFLDAVPNVLEVSIGHALIGEALSAGLAATVRRYLALLACATVQRRPGCRTKPMSCRPPPLAPPRPPTRAP